MNKFHIKHILFLLFLAQCSFSQVVPGYQGKKNIVLYQANMSPAMNHPTFLNKTSSNYNVKNTYPKAEESTFLYPFNFTHTISYERVLRRKFALDFNYSFVASKEYISFNQNGSHNELYTFKDICLNIYGHYFTGSFVFYGKKALAPFGKYFKINLGYCKMMSAFKDKQILSEYTHVAFKTDKVYYGLDQFGMGCSLGMNRIFKSKIVVNRGISFFYPFKGGALDFDKYGFYSAIYRRLQARDLVTFYLGAGYLF